MAETHEVAAQDDSGGRVDVGADVDLAGLRWAAENANHANAGHGWRYVAGEAYNTAPSVISEDPALDADDCRDLQLIAGDLDYVDAEHIAAADPPTILALIARVEAAEAAVKRVRELTRRLDDRIEESAFDPLDILTVTTVREAERQGYLDGVRTIVTNVTIALNGDQ